MEQLTDRELRMLDLMKGGAPYKEIGRGVGLRRAHGTQYRPSYADEARCRQWGPGGLHRDAERAHSMIRQTVREYDMTPDWYGTAYHVYDRDERVCYLLPFNLVVGLWHLIRVRMKIGFGRVAVSRAYERGVRDGKQERH